VVTLQTPTASVKRAIQQASATSQQTVLGASLPPEGAGTAADATAAIKAIAHAFSAYLEELSRLVSHVSGDTVTAGLAKSSGRDIASSQSEAAAIKGTLAPIVSSLISGIHGVTLEISALRGAYPQFTGLHSASMVEELISEPGWTRKVTSALTLTDADRTIVADAAGSAFTVTLPAAPSADQEFRFIRINSGANDVTIGGNGKNINGSGTKVLTTQYENAHLVYDGTEWWVI
jgi:hypothetical protein